MENPEPQKKSKEILPELQVLFWLVIFSAVVFLGYQTYSAFWPKTSQEASLFSEIATEKEGVQVGNSAPGFSGQTVEGETVSLADFRDKKPVLLVFWATWCGYCAKELPDLKAFVREHQEEVKVIALTGEEPKEVVKNYIEENEINFLIGLTDRETWNTYLVRGTPIHFLISKEGKIVGVRPGVMSKKELEEFKAMLTDR